MSEDLNVETVGNVNPTEGKTMASFRIDKTIWTKFGELAKRERLTATQLLTDYIERCLDGDRSMYGVNNCHDITEDSQSINTTTTGLSQADVEQLIDRTAQELMRVTEDLRIQHYALCNEVETLKKPLAIAA